MGGLCRKLMDWSKDDGCFVYVEGQDFVVCTFVMFFSQNVIVFVLTCVFVLKWINSWLSSLVFYQGCLIVVVQSNLYTPVFKSLWVAYIRKKNGISLVFLPDDTWSGRTRIYLAVSDHCRVRTPSNTLVQTCWYVSFWWKFSQGIWYRNIWSCIAF